MGKKTVTIAMALIGLIAVTGCASETANTLPDGLVPREISVTAKKWSFDPNPIVVNQGELVTLKIKSIDVAHGFLLGEFGINERLDPGEEISVQFHADRAGEFGFFCNVPCGSGHSTMSGMLIVNEK